MEHARMSDIDTRKVAALARLQLSVGEIADMGAQLGSILDYVRLLDEVDTTDVEPMTHPVPGENVFRTDAVLPSLPRDAALQNAPRCDGSYFLVPQILDQKSHGK
jgi:aspartyl-tRNA(Asn)/glutamyl-tRNA(Gln) amidotransferase subunit C